MKNFGMFLVAVLGCAVYAAPEQTPAPNYVFNGSFELPGTNPNGWNAAKQQGWVGWTNLPKGANAAENQAYQQINRNIQRKIVQQGAAGKVALSLSCPAIKSPLKLKNVQNKVRQNIKFPATTAPATTLVLSFKTRGTAGSTFYAMVSAAQIDATGQSTPAGKFTSWRVAPSKDWQNHQYQYTVSAGCNTVQLELMLENFGEMVIDDIALRPATK